MYAVVRVAEPDLEQTRASQDQLDEFDRQHRAQPGYRGTLAVDLGDRQLVVNLWDSEEQAAAGRRAMSAAVEHVLNRVMAQPSRLLGSGPVLGLFIRQPS